MEDTNMQIGLVDHLASTACSCLRQDGRVSERSVQGLPVKILKGAPGLLHPDCVGRSTPRSLRWLAGEFVLAASSLRSQHPISGEEAAVRGAALDRSCGGGGGGPRRLLRAIRNLEARLRSHRLPPPVPDPLRRSRSRRVRASDRSAAVAEPGEQRSALLLKTWGAGATETRGPGRGPRSTNASCRSVKEQRSCRQPGRADCGLFTHVKEIA
ncbi:hypothetical protein NDU88_005812 [Pleurodeles waltl]|uniref:Uncharacterized protein n=1 Tax=Pleurodeles waltl TaxID=8319 RepID=A0AAV7LQL1_PLEWA|nr:hypothetical protein NDU88_005812 [Pleurodeles waltl]